MHPLSIVIPTIGNSGTLSRVLTALAHQRHPGPGFEVIVSADADAPRATEQSVSAVADRLELRTTRAETPGAAAARNAGWRMAKSPLVLFLDDDVLADPELVAEHVSWHVAHPNPEVAVLGPLRWADGIRVTPFMRWLETGIHFDFQQIVGDEAGWGRLYACNLSIKRELLDRVSGFDEARFPFHYEDLDLGRRLHDHGLRLLFNRGASAQHLKSETLESWRRRLPGVAAAEYRFARRHPDVQPFFYELFRKALDGPPARNRLARLAAIVGPQTPLIGRRVWANFGWLCRQQLAPVFMAAWEAADRADARAAVGANR